VNRLSAVVERARDLAMPPPAEEKRIGALAKTLLAKTKKAAGRFSEARGVIVGGSLAKGTWLPMSVDLDIFVKIDPSTPEIDFERIGLQIGAMATRGHPMGKKFAQHPYTEATVGGVRVNIVPCFAVTKGHWKSAADRSPFHVELIKRLPIEQKAEVRLLKLFMSGVGVYGAEIQRRGFSGYVAEVLVMQHGSFKSVLEWFATRFHVSDGRPFTLPDPVDEARDLGIAVSGESLGKLILASREFLRRPGIGFFQGMSGRTRSSLEGRVHAMVFSHKKMSEDTLWGELRKTTKHLVRHLETHGFVVARSMAASDNIGRSAILVIPEIIELPDLEQRIGPTVDRREDVKAFISTNARDSRLVWVDDDARVRLLKARVHKRLDPLLVDIAKGREGPIGASRELEAGMKRSAIVLEGRSLHRAANQLRWLKDGIREITSDAVGAR